MEEHNYFSIRINISASVTQEKVATFLARHKSCLAAFECKNKDIKNDHCHVLIWNEVIDETAFKQRLKKEIPGTKGMGPKSADGECGRFAVCTPTRTLRGAIQYICKGYRSAKPNIFVNTSFTQPEIDQFWSDYWKENTILQTKKMEDTSMRQIQVIWDANQDELNLLRDHAQAKPRSTVYAMYAAFWYNQVVDHYHSEFKVWEDAKVTAIINGLLLHTDPILFKVKKEEKIKNLLGLSNADKETFDKFDF